MVHGRSTEAAEAELDDFASGPWGQKFPTVVAAWRRAWTNVIPFFAFPPHVRRVIYTTNSIESVNAIPCTAITTGFGTCGRQTPNGS